MGRYVDITYLGIIILFIECGNFPQITPNQEITNASVETNYEKTLKFLGKIYESVDQKQSIDFDEFVRILGENSYNNIQEFNDRQLSDDDIKEICNTFIDNVDDKMDINELANYFWSICEIKSVKTIKDTDKPQNIKIPNRLQDAYSKNRYHFGDTIDQYSRLYEIMVDLLGNKFIGDKEVELFEQCDTVIKANSLMSQIYPSTTYKSHNNTTCQTILGDSFEAFDGKCTIDLKLFINNDLSIPLCCRYDEIALKIDPEKTIFDYVWLNIPSTVINILQPIINPVKNNIINVLNSDKYNIDKQGLRIDKNTSITTVDYLKKVIDYLKNIESYNVGDVLWSGANNIINSAVKDYLYSEVKPIIFDSIMNCSDHDRQLKLVTDIKELIIKLFENVWIINKDNIVIQYSTEGKISNILITSVKNHMDDDLITNGYDILKICDKLKDYFNDCGIIQGLDGNKTFSEIVSTSILDNLTISNIEQVIGLLTGTSTTNTFNERLLNDKVKVCDIEAKLRVLKTTLSLPVNQPWYFKVFDILPDEISKKYDSGEKCLFCLTTNDLENNGLVKVITIVRDIYVTYVQVKNSIGSANLSPKETDLVNAILKIYHGNDITDVKTRKTILGFHLGTDENVDDSLLCYLDKTGIAQYILCAPSIHYHMNRIYVEKILKDIFYTMFPNGTKFKDNTSGKSVYGTIIYDNYNSFEVWKTKKASNKMLNLVSIIDIVDNNIGIRIPLNLQVSDPINVGYNVIKLTQDNAFVKGDQLFDNKQPYKTPGLAQVLGFIGDIDDNGNIIGNYEYTVKAKNKDLCQDVHFNKPIALSTV